jgi:hypothetical protein
MAEQISETVVNRINAGNRPDADKRTNNPDKNGVIYQKLLKGKLEHLLSEDRAKIEPVLRKFAHVFHESESNEFKATDLVEHQIV